MLEKREQPMDQIIISDFRLFARHGVNAEEKQNGQFFLISLILHADLSAACVSDRLADTVNYAAVIKSTREAFCRESFDLIERAADAVTNALFAAFSPVREIEITVKKPQAPISAELAWAAVRLRRTRP